MGSVNFYQLFSGKPQHISGHSVHLQIALPLDDRFQARFSFPGLIYQPTQQDPLHGTQPSNDDRRQQVVEWQPRLKYPWSIDGHQGQRYPMTGTIAARKKCAQDWVPAPNPSAQGQDQLCF